MSNWSLSTPSLTESEVESHLSKAIEQRIAAGEDVENLEKHPLSEEDVTALQAAAKSAAHLAEQAPFGAKKRFFVHLGGTSTLENTPRRSEPEDLITIQLVLDREAE